MWKKIFFIIALSLQISACPGSRNDPAVIPPIPNVPACNQGYCAPYNQAAYAPIGCPINYVPMPSANGTYCISEIVYQHSFVQNGPYGNPFPQVCDSYNGASCSIGRCVARNGRYGICQ